MRRVLATVLTAFVVVAWVATPAYADDTFTRWTPEGVLPGQWRTAVPGSPQPFAAGNTECTAQERAWTDVAVTMRVELTWYTCTGDMDAVVADLDDRRGGSYYVAGVPSVLGDGVDVFEQEEDANQRTWVEGRYRVTVFAECGEATVAQCRALTAAAARDVSGRLPGQPVKTVGSRSTEATNWLFGVALFVLLVLAAVAGMRRARQPLYPVAAGVRRWFPVDADARRARRRGRLHRIALLLLAPVVLAALLMIVRSLAGTVDVDAAALVLLWAVLFGGPAAVMLFRARGAPRADNWRWQMRQLDLPRHRRIIAVLLDVGSAVTLVYLVFLFVVGLSSGNVIALPVELEAFAQLQFFFLLLVAWPVGRWVRRRALADAWMSLNARPGQPILFVRGFGGENALIRATTLGRRGPLHYVARLLKAQRRQPFEDVLANLLVRHGRLIALQPAGWPLPRLGATTYNLGTDGTERQRLAAAVRDAQMVVLLVGDRPASRALARDVVAACTDRPLLLILPPGLPDEVANQWRAWWQAVIDVEPVSNLHLSFVPTGTHVLVHVPNDGWYGWGASYRDEFTYAAAVHDAVAHAAASIQRIRRAGDVPPEQEAVPEARTVDVVTAAADEPAARAMAGVLTSRGMPAATAVAPLPADHRVPHIAVVVVSSAAPTDPDWQSAVNHLLAAGARPIPVVCGVIDAATLPKELRVRNWLRWSETPTVVEIAALYSAVTSDPQRYTRHRDLLTRATTWVANNRSDALLISGRDETEAAVAHLIEAERDPLARPSPLLHDFVTASAAAARRRRRHRTRWLVSGVSLGLITVLLVSFGLVLSRGPARNSRLTTMMGLVSQLATDRPDWMGVLAGALIVQGDEKQAASARRTLRSTLNHTWPDTLAVAHDTPITDMAMVDAEDLLTTDAAGTLTRWVTADGSVRWRRSLGARVTHLAVTRDGRHAVAASADALHLITTDPWLHRVVSVRGKVIEVAVSGDGTAYYATEGGVLGTVGTRNRSARYPAVLDLRADEQSVRALVRTSAREVAVIDPLTDRITARAVAAQPASGVEYGAVQPDGEYLAYGAAEGELVAGVPGAVAPVGHRLPRLAYDLDVLPGGRLITASPAYGMVAIHTPSSLVTARLQVGQPGGHRVRLSPDGRFLLSTSGLGVSVWRTDALWPTLVAPTMMAAGSAPRATAGDLVAHGDAEGVVTVGSSRYPAFASAVTALALSPDRNTAVAGSRLGEVAEIDLNAGVIVRRWSSPIGGSVHTIGWDASGRLAIRTASWFTTESCAGCGSDDRLLDALRARVQACYAAPNLDGITDDTRRRLGLRVCGPSPKAR